MTRKRLSLVVGVGLVTLLCGRSPAWAQTVGNAQSFAIVGGTGVNANGVGSVITGDVGIEPAAGTFITGFPPNAIVVPPFSVHGNDSTAIAARPSITALNLALSSPPAAPPTLRAPQLGTVSLGPGVYNFAANALITGGNLTLTTPGLYIFQVPTDLTVGVGNSVVLGVGVDPCNVFWRIGTLAILNGNLVGNVVAGTGVHMGVGVTLQGRALVAAGGDVTLAGGDFIGGCSVAAAGPLPTPPVPAPVVPATDLFIVKHHTTLFAVGTNAAYSIALFNGGGLASTGTTTIVDTLPAGLTFVSATGVGWSCSASGQVVTCTTDSSVPAAGPFANSITLTVLPTAAAVPTVTNTAVVSGGGDSIAVNNSTADITTVAVAVPTLSEWALIMLALLLTAAGIVALTRRRAA